MNFNGATILTRILKDTFHLIVTEFFGFFKELFLTRAFLAVLKRYARGIYFHARRAAVNFILNVRNLHNNLLNRKISLNLIWPIKNSAYCTIVFWQST